MIESPEWKRITAYAAENRIKMAMQAIELHENMAVEANNSSQTNIVETTKD